MNLKVNVYLIKRPTSFVAHWKPATTLSLISFRYYKSRLKVSSQNMFQLVKNYCKAFRGYLHSLGAVNH